MKVAVVGAGAWGTVVASLLAPRVETMLWARERDVAAAINETQENPPFLPGATLAADLRASTDLVDVLADAGLVVMAVPSPFYRSVLTDARLLIGHDVGFLSLSKGIEQATLLRMSEVAAEVLDGHDDRRLGVLSGPNIAREVLEGQPSATVVAMPDLETASQVQSLMMTDTLRVYTNPDVIGCEIGGVVKNVIAIAAGMAYGLGYGQNTLAALLTRGLAELTRLGVAVGGQPLTFLGLAGIGDLMVTCHSPDSRNHHVGVELGRGRSIADVLEGMRSVAEGVRSCFPLLALAAKVGVELPICEQVAAVLDGQTQPGQAVAALLHRQPKPELRGIG